MPSFDFTLVKKPKTRKTVKSHDTFRVLDKNVIGVIWITKTANYYVKSNNRTYNISPECYSCKGKRRIYRQGSYDINRFSYIRLIDDCCECDSKHWLPFAVGCIVKGDIVYNSNSDKYLFNIKDIWIDYDDIDAQLACNFYRKHLTEINNIIRNK